MRSTPLWVVLSGCSDLGSARDFDPRELEREGGWLVAPGVRWIPQKSESDCGAAALAMALTYWGSPMTVEDVISKCPSATREGILARDLRDLARRRELRAYLLRGEIGDLEKELSARRPVLVGLVKPNVGGGLAHYELVVAFHRERRLIVTLDPDRGWRRNDFCGFMEEWEPADRLTLVLFRDVGRPQ